MNPNRKEVVEALITLFTRTHKITITFNGGTVTITLEPW